jgi:hypothetical protein
MFAFLSHCSAAPSRIFRIADARFYDIRATALEMSQTWSGQIQSIDTNMTLSATTFDNVYALFDIIGDGTGGAVFAYACNATISRCAFSENGAHYGGAVALLSSPANLTLNRFHYNTAISDFGALWSTTLAFDLETDVISCNFTSNSASRYYGAVMANVSAVRFAFCDLLQNSAGKAAGAIGILRCSSAFLDTATFVNNSRDQTSNHCAPSLWLQAGAFSVVSAVIANTIFFNNFVANQRTHPIVTYGVVSIHFIGYNCFDSQPGQLVSYLNSPCSIQIDSAIYDLPELHACDYRYNPPTRSFNASSQW